MAYHTKDKLSTKKRKFQKKGGMYMEFKEVKRITLIMRGAANYLGISM